MSKAKKSVHAHRERPDTELLSLLEQRKKDLFEMRMKAYSDQERSPAQIRQIRRDIARVQTVLRQRTLAAQAGVAKQ